MVPYKKRQLSRVLSQWLKAKKRRYRFSAAQDNDTRHEESIQFNAKTFLVVVRRELNNNLQNKSKIAIQQVVRAGSAKKGENRLAPTNGKILIFTLSEYVTY